jgi:UDP-3-O-[3-hydroxymyristoyl] glucosamine N-acyltransferase
MEFFMIPNTLQNNKTPFRIMQSTLIGLPSPGALKSDNFPGVTIGSDPIIGNHCVIFGNVFIGNRFKCGDNVLIRENTSIGDEVTVGNCSCIESSVVIADNVTIGDNVSVPRLTRIGRRVLINPDVRFLNGHNTMIGTRGILLEDGCTIGKNAVIGPGICVGAGAVVDEDAVVTMDVPAKPKRSI